MSSLLSVGTQNIIEVSRPHGKDYLAVEFPEPIFVLNPVDAKIFGEYLSKKAKIRVIPGKQKSYYTSPEDIKIIHFLKLKTLQEQKMPSGRVAEESITVSKHEEAVLSICESIGINAFRMKSTSGECWTLNKEGLKKISKTTITGMIHENEIIMRCVTTIHANNDHLRNLVPENEDTTIETVNKKYQDKKELAEKIILALKDMFRYY
ncbi:hypothetical protein HY483_03930 [Candidatus Woesearchaeota archaeon]|nr:hypothetical protein [Candidatus Woesearchaeota archaeon]